MAISLLTDREIKGAKAKAKPYRMPDGGNLYCFVASSGVKSWQFRYRLNGKPHTFTIGKYPATSLEIARQEAIRARRDVAEGKQLTHAKRVAQQARIADSAEILERVAAAWLVDEHRRQNWSPDYRIEVEASLRNHLGALYKIPISDITARLVAPVLRAIQLRAPLMLEKVHRRLRGIMDYAVEEGLIQVNPLPQRRARVERKHYPAITDLPTLGDVLRAARASDPCKGIQRAHQLTAFTAMRISEIVGAVWAEFDLDRAAWSIPRERMKRKDAKRGPHVVPIPPALLAQVKAWREADGPDAVYVCPAPRDAGRPITAEGVEKYYRDVLGLAGRHSPHSWRSAFSTVCRDAGKAGETIEAQLDHVVGNKIEAAYDRAKRVDLRRELMTWYENTLIAARDGAEVVALRGGRAV